MGTSWEYIEINKKNPICSLSHPPQSKKSLGLLGACCFTSLAAKFVVKLTELCRNKIGQVE
jgi:hypothetical protein